jgi:hypothetical protein
MGSAGQLDVTPADWRVHWKPLPRSHMTQVSSISRVMVSWDSHWPQRRSSPGFIGPSQGVMVIGHRSTQDMHCLQKSGRTAKGYSTRRSFPRPTKPRAFACHVSVHEAVTLLRPFDTCSTMHRPPAPPFRSPDPRRRCPHGLLVVRTTIVKSRTNCPPPALDIDPFTWYIGGNRQPVAGCRSDEVELALDERTE